MVLCFGVEFATRGLIPYDGSINFTQWLQDQHQNDKRKRMYKTGELSARFLREEAIPAINEVVQNLDRTMDVVYDLFEERIELNDEDAKFADVWPIENIWGIMKEKRRGKIFENLDALIDFVSAE
ncbi:unnamed protein product [Rotaria sordida]|uniref:Uncharacterized protein n=1 Tax=Rotaria sordida TaxID=392033 RepID=A0A815ATA6_9BILA|nr:unnamed protein product [Rotaria sordida]CAF1108443.1 unnamed protein product [Rotaria sordida]CAF1264030.1 unnamed protein product [Rotaria sordida]CAF1391775.1 unnamed protein product [Rotaria sordida]CAF4153384.1 unnamed protein product [Rotaria sordida]